MPLKVTRTWLPPLTTPLLNKVHTIVVPLGLPQLPTVRPLVTLSTWPLTYPVKPVPAGNVTVI